MCVGVHSNLIGGIEKLVVIRFGQFHSREQVGYDPLEEWNVRSQELRTEEKTTLIAITACIVI